MAEVPPFHCTELLPLGDDDTEYRLVTTEGVSTFDTPEGTFLKVEPEAIRALTAEAMHDIAHYPRSGHLQQLRNILDDPEASDNDRFVALDLLKNAAIAEGGVLPMRQDTGTAIVKGQVGGMPFVPLRLHTVPGYKVRLKRVFDLVLVLVFAPLWVPLLAFLAVYVLVTAGRPVFYRQSRVGRDEVVFSCVKFRTMVPDAESDGLARLASKDDQRVAPALRCMRSTRADELPQLWNVLRDQMSLVGPRPERPELVAEIVERVPGYVRRNELPPGLTGLAQVHGRYGTDPEYKLGYDLQYLVNWSIVIDIQILFRTVWVVVSRRV